LASDDRFLHERIYQALFATIGRIPSSTLVNGRISQSMNSNSYSIESFMRETNSENPVSNNSSQQPNIPVYSADLSLDLNLITPVTSITTQQVAEATESNHHSPYDSHPQSQTQNNGHIDIPNTFSGNYSQFGQMTFVGNSSRLNGSLIDIPNSNTYNNNLTINNNNNFNQNSSINALNNNNNNSSPILPSLDIPNSFPTANNLLNGNTFNNTITQINNSNSNNNNSQININNVLIDINTPNTNLSMKSNQHENYKIEANNNREGIDIIKIDSDKDCNSSVLKDLTNNNNIDNNETSIPGNNNDNVDTNFFNNITGHNLTNLMGGFIPQNYINNFSNVLNNNSANNDNNNNNINEKKRSFDSMVLF
jgi:hypothetical protein